MFEHSLTFFKESTSRIYQEAIAFALDDVFNLKPVDETIIDLIVPFGELNFDINHQIYLEYES